MTIKRSLRVAVPALALAATAGLIGGAALPERQAPRAMNFLLMGTDGRDTITAAEKNKFHAGGIACGCTDVLMLVHVSARRDRVSVVSLPRDSLAQIPAHRDPVTGKNVPLHPAKINAAYEEGGPELALATVESMTGMEIDSYLQVDFRRFMDTVEQVGGVEVCTARRLDDPATKLSLAPGTYRLNGGQSLQYVRSRKVDTSADLGRIQRQHRFLVAALRGLQADGRLTDPDAMGRVVRTLLGSGRVEQGFAALDLLELAAELNRVPASATEFTTVPVAGFNPDLPGIGSTLKWDRDKAARMFDDLRRDQPLVAPGTDPRPQDPPGFAPAPAVRGSALACA
ncbi:LCP family protein [Streptomyces sp. NPDC093094]|uniref:LCP family protein n=1 Tax=Streptomyces sp. NPDC093094 TaxID=3366026 RepID=UPI00381C29CE